MLKIAGPKALIAAGTSTPAKKCLGSKFTPRVSRRLSPFERVLRYTREPDAPRGNSSRHDPPRTRCVCPYGIAFFAHCHSRPRELRRPRCRYQLGFSHLRNRPGSQERHYDGHFQLFASEPLPEHTSLQPSHAFCWDEGDRRDKSELIFNRRQIICLNSRARFLSPNLLQIA